MLGVLYRCHSAARVVALATVTFLDLAAVPLKDSRLQTEKLRGNRRELAFRCDDQGGAEGWNSVARRRATAGSFEPPRAFRRAPA